MRKQTHGRALVATLAIMAAGVIAIAAPPTASAETRVETVLGTVTSSDPIRSSYIRKTPSDQRVCEVQHVPVYEEVVHEESDNLGSMIVGGLIGSAIGNEVSDQHGAGAAGAVIGAILGREDAIAAAESEQAVVGYREQEVCSIRKVMVEEEIESITGYRNHVEVDGKIITVESKRPIAVNSRVEITRRTTYNLR